MKTTEFLCPVCKLPLVSFAGTQTNAEDGVTIECRNPVCKMADWAHGTTEKAAFEVFVEKCGRSLK